MNTFKAIYENIIDQFPVQNFQKFYANLNRGRAILQNSDECNTYMASYAPMHAHKLYSAFDSLFKNGNFKNKNIQIIDWGCGQALASCVISDYINENQIPVKIEMFTLIDPSKVVLEIGLKYLKRIVKDRASYEIFNKSAEEKLSFQSKKNDIKIHLFSNVLDMENINRKFVFQNIINNFSGVNYFVCISPCNAERLFSFAKLFNGAEIISKKTSSFAKEIFRPSNMKNMEVNISRIEIIFKVNL